VVETQDIKSVQIAVAMEELRLDDYSNEAVERTIDLYIHSIRDREVLKRRLIDGIRYEKLAEDFEMSVRQIKNIVYKGERIIFKKI